MYTNQELKNKIAQYEFYHVIKLADSISTPGTAYPNEHLDEEAMKRINFKDKRVLDIGCRDGKFSFMAEQMGASEVIGIDNDLSLAATEFLIPYFQSKVKMHEMNLMHLTPQSFGKFDIVLFFGVLYHLRYPFYALKLLRDLLNDGGVILIETAVLCDDNKNALLYCPIGNESPYEDTSCTFYNEKGLRDTLTSIGLTTEKVDYLTFTTHLSFSEKLKQSVNKLAFNKEKLKTDRAVFTCRLDKSIVDKDVLAYWDETHTLEVAAKREEKWQPSSK